MSTTLYCTATNSQADVILRELKNAGFSGNDISLLMASKEETEKLAMENNTKAPEGAATGAGSGAVLGGALGWIAGIGALAIPGLGPFIAAGPIMAALGGAAIGGTVGGISGALIGMGIPEIEAKRYEGKVKGGDALIAVECSDGVKAQRAREICERAGAHDLTTSNLATTTSRAR